MMCLYVFMYLISVVVAAYLMVNYVTDVMNIEDHDVKAYDVFPILICSILSPLGILVGMASRIDWDKSIWSKKK